jgi:hypothetical protein
VWIWIAIGGGLTFGLSALISLALGALLATIGRETGELFETEMWTTAPAPGRRWPTAEA